MAKLDDYDPKFIEEQQQVLRAIIEFRYPLEQLYPLDKIGWNWNVDGPEGDIVTFYGQDAINVLNRVLKQELTDRDLYDWAEAVVARPTIAHEEKSEDLVKELLNEIIVGYPQGLPLTHVGLKEYVIKLMSVI